MQERDGHRQSTARNVDHRAVKALQRLFVDVDRSFTIGILHNDSRRRRVFNVDGDYSFGGGLKPSSGGVGLGNFGCGGGGCGTGFLMDTVFSAHLFKGGFGAEPLVGAGGGGLKPS